MPTKNILLSLLALVALQSCATPRSVTIPDYSATRVKVNTGSAQSASLTAKSSALEIKNSQAEIDRLSAHVETLKEARCRR